VIVLRDGTVAGAFDTMSDGHGAIDAGALALRAQELARSAR